MINIPVKIKQPLDTKRLTDINKVTSRPEYLGRKFSQPVPQAWHSGVLRQPGGIQTARKGQKISLQDLGNGIDNLDVIISWDTNRNVYDLDVECFMVDKQNKVIGDDWFVFYGSLKSPDMSVIHNGDTGNDEIISIQLSRVDHRVQKLVIILTINEARKRGLNFSGVSNARMMIVDKNSGKGLLEFTLADYYDTVTSMVIGEIYRYNGYWKFNAVGNGVAADLLELCQRYGVNAEG